MRAGAPSRQSSIDPSSMNRQSQIEQSSINRQSQIEDLQCEDQHAAFVDRIGDRRSPGRGDAGGGPGAVASEPRHCAHRGRSAGLRALRAERPSGRRAPRASMCLPQPWSPIRAGPIFRLFQEASLAGAVIQGSARRHSRRRREAPTFQRRLKYFRSLAAQCPR